MLVTSCWIFSSCQKEIKQAENPAPGDAKLKIQFKTVVDGEGLVFGKTYTNAFSEAYSVSAFKFYLHGIELINTQTNTIFTVDKNNYYLIDAADSASTLIQLDILPSMYNRIAFVIGVDSTRNVSGAQTGALDPAKGMFWTWSTGYIMAKLEGNSPVAATPNNVIEYHVGGFKSTESVLRKIVLDFPASQNIDIREGANILVNITANINSWFNHINPILISQKPVSMSPGIFSMQIADNYARMFTVAEIINE